MKFLADLHLHSHFSRATSPQLSLPHLHKWAQLKGITVIGTGDLIKFTCSLENVLLYFKR